MFVQNTDAKFLDINAKTGQFRTGKELLPNGTQFIGTLHSVELKHDEGSKAHKIKASDEVLLKFKSGDDFYLLTINFRTYLGLKFLCQVPSLQSPHLTIVPKLNGEFAEIFIGSRPEAESGVKETTFCKFPLTFDKECNIFNRENKEIHKPAELIEKMCEFLSVELTDKRPQA